MDNYDGVEVMLAAGADPLARGSNGRSSSVVRTLASRYDKRSRELLKYIVCRGDFDHTETDVVQGMINFLSPSGPKNPDRESLYKKLTMRLLKYHPEINEDYHTNRIFNGHIPWKEILDTKDRELCDEQQ